MTSAEDGLMNLLEAMLNLAAREARRPKPPPVKPGGFPEDQFVDLNDEEREEFTCNICYQVLKETMQCVNEHKFCHSCLLVWSTTGVYANRITCPVCRTQGYYFRDTELDDKISEKKVKCHMDACHWSGKCKQLLSHRHTNYEDDKPGSSASASSEVVTMPRLAQAPPQVPSSGGARFMGTGLTTRSRIAEPAVREYPTPRSLASLRQIIDTPSSLSRQTNDTPNFLSRQTSETPNALSRQTVDTPNLLSRQNIDTPNLLSRQNMETPNLLSRQNVDTPNLLSRQISDTPNLLIRQMSETPNLLSRQNIDTPNLLSRQISDTPNALSRQIIDTPSSLSNTSQETVVEIPPSTGGGRRAILAQSGPMSRRVPPVRTTNRIVFNHSGPNHSGPNRDGNNNVSTAASTRVLSTNSTSQPPSTMPLASMLSSTMPLASMPSASGESLASSINTTFTPRPPSAPRSSTTVNTRRLPRITNPPPPRGRRTQATEAPLVPASSTPSRPAGNESNLGEIRDRLQESRHRLDNLMSSFSGEMDHNRQQMADFQQERERQRREQLDEVRELGQRLGQVAGELRRMEDVEQRQGQLSDELRRLLENRRQVNLFSDDEEDVE